MKNPLIKIASTKNTQTDNQAQQLRTLWDKVKHHQLRNAKAEDKVIALYSQYERRVLPHEKRMGQALCSWVEHLLGYMDSKSMKIHNRKRLLTYLDEELCLLHNHSHFCDQDRLAAISERFDQYYTQLFGKEMDQALDDSCDLLEEVIQSMCGDSAMPDRQQLRDVIKRSDPNEVEHLIHCIAAGHFTKHSGSQTENTDACNEWHDVEFEYYEDEDDESSKIKEVFKSSQLNVIYKRVASVVHPDKERDPVQKEEKTRLMQRLANAKKEGDIVTLISMYTEFVPDGDYCLDESTYGHIQHLLEMQVRELNIKHKDIFNGQGFRSYVWKTFSDSSKKKVDAKLAEHIDDLEQDIRTLERRIKRVNSRQKVIEFIQSV